MSKYRYRMECVICGEINTVVNHRTERTLAACETCGDITTHEIE